jgi:hypothetical protein
LGKSLELFRSQPHLTNQPDLYAELVRSFRVEQEVQKDHLHHGVQGHQEANGVTDLKNKDYSPQNPSISQENENYKQWRHRAHNVAHLSNFQNSLKRNEDDKQPFTSHV